MNPGSLFDEIRSASHRVMCEARYVTIVSERVRDYALSLPLEQARSPQLDQSSHFLSHGEATLAYIITLDAINFGSGYFPHLEKRPGMSGYYTVAASLTDWFGARGPLSAEALAGLTTRDCVEIFGQSESNQPIVELMSLFARSLNDLGQYLLSKFGGRFAALVAAANHSAERLVRLLAKMPLFNDVQQYGELTVPFFKRAQLTAADLSLALGGEGLGWFEDLDRMTIFADNLVPHVLRVDGLLRYDPSLAERIDRGELIPRDSLEEIEIRAAAVETVERLAEAIREAGRPITSAGLDYLLWNRGQQPYYKQAKPRHRARTTNY